MDEAGAVSAAESTPSSDDGLAFRGEVFVNFRHSRQWVDIKLFALPEGAGDDAVLAMLIGHRLYRDSYALGSQEKHEAPIHGPYRLEVLTSAAYSPVSAEDAEALLRTWAEYEVPLPDIQRDELERELYSRIRAASSCYQLANLGRSAWHDWGGVVGSSTGFHEFVLIDRATASVALVVASDD
ncbi:hypothetical protein BST20_18225 [Mycobacterium branderi]|uniref:Uncharacterized protein n=1 Tax=Mycobacterium branderi TaxID=43348 RepID=A0A7I7WE89_9MYCO|nr:hypothetical protein BST20_18225 [Mycobacterium branderi]BBZ15242.1 hypothetical protein MBRA_54370 [Mycobacterium branderi]